MINHQETPIRSPKQSLGILWFGFLLAPAEINSALALGEIGAALPKNDEERP